MNRPKRAPARPPLRAAAIAAAIAAACLAAPAAASAHGISGLASLPVPAWLFAWAAAAVLVISFVLLAALWSTPRLQQPRERRRFAWPRGLYPLTAAIGLALLALVVWAGFAGSSDSLANIDPTFIYVVVWVAVPVSSVILGDWFKAFNPWIAIARGARAIGARVGIGWRPRAYPERLGRWPAAAGLLGFGWLELVYHDHDNPVTLAILTLAYVVVMLGGMAAFGIEQWSDRADPLGVYFSFAGRLSALRTREGALWTRPLLSGAPSLSELPGTLAVVLVIIGTTTFDGASNGVVWTTIQPHVQSFFTGLGLGETPSDELADSIGLLLAVAFVSGLYRIGVVGMRSVSHRYSASRLSRSFAHTLIPIGLAYVLAHYFSFLIWQGQEMAHLASDPLGRGWNLFGTAGWHVNYHVMSINAIWYTQVAALVAGHVAALALAHDRALAAYSSPTQAVRSQYWMLVVMVCFTSLGLWLLSAVNT